MTRTLSCSLAALFSATTAFADAPKVITDFGPTQGIVARVMDGVAVPTALLTGTDTPHDFALRPSQARDVSNADLVVWIGHAMSPWLEDPLENLGADATQIELLETEGWTLLANRDEDGDEDDHDAHDDEHDDDEEHAHDDDHDDHEDDHDDHGDEHDQDDAHADDDDHTEDDHAEHDDHGHGHGPNDPHAWLDPDIAAVWAVMIADALGKIDPDNAAVYASNAAAFGAEMTVLGDEISATLADVAPDTLLLSHDNMQYFEVRFDFEPAGFIAETDAAEPGPAHLREIRDLVAEGQITCILSDIETNPGTLAMLRDGSDIGTAMIDATDSAGAGYAGMMRSIAGALASCAS